ncbi:2-hydroxy-3-oxopropionate reductase [Pigmentiphaga humi]|uniref:2-hydroxy-3-oxopropionate reductase n=1 Tax=Pigmentiphaga humi TaxID=2478468 RepID=A0A3P4B0Q6_9BURK|nr:NAD(P)-dependent oxidoreductase [Pigmentiphaga humi]VCU69238.1 2-hydroxy-3-oxopropionate reductase [Pigmentiphaga humi]
MNRESIGQDETVGIIGIGRMGEAIANRLLDAGREVVVWNRSPGKTAELAGRGAGVAASPLEVARRCRTVIVIVRDDLAMQAVYFSDQGLLRAPLRDRVIVDMTTATVAAMKQAGQAVVGAGGAFLDAPVSGTVAPARSGQLLVLAGGSAEHLDRARRVLEKLARKITHVGPLGSGIAMKLVLNLPLATYWQTLGEALAMGRAYGLDVDTMLGQIADSKAAIGALSSKLDTIMGRAERVEFDLAGLRKDLAAMRATAAEAGLVLPASSAAAESAARADEAGWGGRDLAQLVRFVAGLE